MTSQNNEDFILQGLLQRLGEGRRRFVEIGTGPDARECNTKALADQGWAGTWIDKDGVPPVLTARVDAENVNKLVGAEFLDVFSLDIDGNDYWVWKAMLNKPRIVVIEYNQYYGLERRVQPYDSAYVWDGNPKEFGASLLSMVDLGNSKGYRFVDCNGVNAFFTYS